MKKSAKNSERGQALILIVFAIIGLVGLTALTVDGGLAYSDRRRAQNAADAAAFAAARSMIREEDWKAAALNLASLNGYTDTDDTVSSSSTMTNVEVYSCDQGESTCGTYAGNDEYIQVLITSTINTYFGKVIGVSQLTNQVNSITHAEPGAPDPDSWGNAMESLMPGCGGGGGWSYDPLRFGGGGSATVIGSGVKVNSTCDHYAITQNGGGSLTAAEGICVPAPGEVDPGAGSGISPAPTHDCQPSPERPWPEITCDNNPENGIIDAAELGAITEVMGGVYESTPGYYYGDFPSGISCGGTCWLLMKQGVYCIETGDFDVGSTLSVKSDVNPINGAHDYQTEGVLIYVKTGGITLNGSSTFVLHAISDPSQPPRIRNLLFYLPPGNTSTVKINGNGSSTFTGSIWAPSAHIMLDGTSGTVVNSQVVGYSLDVGGGSGLQIKYDQKDNAVVMSPSSIELAE